LENCDNFRTLKVKDLKDENVSNLGRKYTVPDNGKAGDNNPANNPETILMTRLIAFMKILPFIFFLIKYSIDSFKEIFSLG